MEVARARLTIGAVAASTGGRKPGSEELFLSRAADVRALLREMPSVLALVILGGLASFPGSISPVSASKVASVAPLTALSVSASPVSAAPFRGGVEAPPRETRLPHLGNPRCAMGDVPRESSRADEVREIPGGAKLRVGDLTDDLPRLTGLLIVDRLESSTTSSCRSSGVEIRSGTTPLAEARVSRSIKAAGMRAERS